MTGNLGASCLPIYNYFRSLAENVGVHGGTVYGTDQQRQTVCSVIHSHVKGETTTRATPSFTCGQLLHIPRRKL